MQSLCLQRTTQHRQTRTNIHASSDQTVETHILDGAATALAILKTAVFTDVAPCGLVKVYRRVKRLLPPSLGLVALKMETASSYLHTNRRRNLKSH